MGWGRCRRRLLPAAVCVWGAPCLVLPLCICVFFVFFLFFFALIVGRRGAIESGRGIVRVRGKRGKPMKNTSLDKSKMQNGFY